jgi:hypothetical protein
VPSRLASASGRATFAVPGQPAYCNLPGFLEFESFPKSFPRVYEMEFKMCEMRRFRNATAFLGANPTDVLITSGLPSSTCNASCDRFNEWVVRSFSQAS